MNFKNIINNFYNKVKIFLHKFKLPSIQILINQKPLKIKHKVLLGILFFIPIIMFIFSISNINRNSTPNYSDVKNSILGKEISVFSNNITITKENLKNIKILNFNHEPNNTVLCTTNLELLDDDSNIYLEGVIKYKKDGHLFKNDWTFLDFSPSFFPTVTPITNANDSLKKLLLNTSIVIDNSEFLIDSTVLDTLEITKSKGDDINKTFDCTVLFSNGLTNSKIPINVNISFDKKLLSWVLNDVSVDSNPKQEQLNFNIDDNINKVDIEKYLPSILPTTITLNDKFTLNKNDISSIDVTNFYTYSKDKLNVYFNFNASNKLFEFENCRGSIYIEFNGLVPTISYQKFYCENANLKDIEIPLEELKNIITGSSINGKEISKETADTFKFSRMYDLTQTKFKVFGEMKVDAKLQSVIFVVCLKQDDSGEYSFEVENKKIRCGYY